MTRDLFRAYLAESRAAGMALSSLRTRAAVLRSWLVWLTDEGLIQRVPRFDTPTPRREIPRVPTPEQIEAVLGACDDGTVLGVRDRALILFLYGAAARASEAAHLELHDLDLDRRRATVLGKGDRRRIVALTPRAVDALVAYLPRRMPPMRPQDSEAVFVTRVGTRMTRDMIGRSVKARGTLAGVPWIHPHLFRHAAATHLLDGGADLRHVQEVLGHVAITSTQIYTQVSVDRMTETVARFHPHAAAGVGGGR